jgi:ABC-type multidrug transport system ATPase subunit
MQGRTVILVSHHVQLCAPGASYIATLDNARVLFEGSKEDFYSSGIRKTLIQSTESSSGEVDDKEEKVILEKEGEAVLNEELDPRSATSSPSTVAAPSTPASTKANKKPARKQNVQLVALVEISGKHISGQRTRNVCYWLLS